MKSKFFLFLTLLLITSSLYSRERMPIATIDLDHSLRANEPLRKEIVRAINRFAYLKQKTSISVDRAKRKLYSTNELTLEQGLTVASNLNIKVAIIMESEKVLKNTNNAVSNNNIVIDSDNINTVLSNYNITNNIINNDIVITNGITLTNEIKDLGDLSDNINTVLSNYNITNNIISNDMTITNGITLTNEIKDLGDLIEYGLGKKTEGTDKAADEKSDEELYDIKYNFKVIDIETMENKYKFLLKELEEIGEKKPFFGRKKWKRSLEKINQQLNRIKLEIKNCIEQEKNSEKNKELKENFRVIMEDLKAFNLEVNPEIGVELASITYEEAMKNQNQLRSYVYEIVIANLYKYFMTKTY